MTFAKKPQMPPVQFAVNYSPALESLLLKGKVDADLIKCPDWPDLIARARIYRPVYVHFPIFAGKLEDEAVDLERIDELFHATETPHVNIHLDPQIGSQRAEQLHWHDVLERTTRDVSLLERRFGASRVVIENVPFWADRDMHLRLAAEPWFIRRVVEETGAGLLLDLSHARIAARSFGMDERQYIEELPTERLREVHVTGIGVHQGWLRDHLPMQAEDWSLFDWAMDNIRQRHWTRPRIVAFEYGGIGERFDWRTDPAVLDSQVPRLYEAIRRLQLPAYIPDAA